MVLHSRHDVACATMSMPTLVLAFMDKVRLAILPEVHLKWRRLTCSTVVYDAPCWDFIFQPVLMKTH